jgi:hypothetical protein
MDGLASSRGAHSIGRPTIAGARTNTEFTAVHRPAITVFCRIWAPDAMPTMPLGEFEL